MQLNGSGKIGVIGSIAGDRGKKSTIFYSAAKSFLENYVQGMQHKLYTSAISISLIKLGPTNTPMASRSSAKFLGLADPDRVSKTIIESINEGRQSTYVPSYWRWLMLLLRICPDHIYNKLKI